MATDLSVAWQFFSKRTIVFFVMDQTPCTIKGVSFLIGRHHKLTGENFVFLQVCGAL
jgi:hypothetical protein